jgi:hypothetical protein
MPVRSRVIEAMVRRALPGKLWFSFGEVAVEADYSQQEYDAETDQANELYETIVDAIDWNRVRDEAVGVCLVLEHEHFEDPFSTNTYPCGKSIKTVLLATERNPRWK